MGFFSFLNAKLPIDKAQIEQQIRASENQTSAEIRVVVERKAKKTAQGDVLARAQALFDELEMAQTAESNGVLIYLSFKPQQIAVVGDSGIHAKVGDEFWQSVYQAMKQHCTAGDFTAALCQGVQQVGIELARYFPIQEDDINELPDEVIIK